MLKSVQFCSFISFILFFIPTNFWGFFCTSQKPAPRTSRSFSKAVNLLAFILCFPSVPTPTRAWQKLSHSPKLIHSHTGVRDDQLLTLLNAFAHQGFAFEGQFRDRCLVVNLARKVDMTWMSASFWGQKGGSRSQGSVVTQTGSWCKLVNTSGWV